MSSRPNKSVTLVELIIAITLISVIVIGFSSIELFSRYHALTSDRRARIQNEVSYVLEHMTKQISRAIGNERVFTNNTVINIANIGGNTAVRIRIDSNLNGQRDAADRWIAYRFTGAIGANLYQIRYCPQCTTPACTTCTPVWGTADNILSRSITGFARTKPGSPLNGNWVEISVTARWQPNQAASPDNPEVTMRTRIKMPSVSTN